MARTAAMPPAAETAGRPREAAPAAGVAATVPVQATIMRRWTLATTFLGALLVLAVIAALGAGRLLLVPVVAAVLLAVALGPLVRRIRNRGVPPGIAATLVALGLIVVLIGLGQFLVMPLTQALDTIPAFEGLVERLQRGATRVLGEPHAAWLATRWQEVVSSGTWSARLFGGIVEFWALAFATLLLLFFLLASGDLFLQKLVSVLPRVRDKVKAVTMVRAVQDEVGRYLAVVTLINAALGTIAGFIAWFFDLPSPVLWGTLVALLNFIPYVGAIANVLILTAVSAATHSMLDEILAAPLLFAAVTAIEGNIIAPLLVSRRVRLNAVTVVVGLMFWGWLWGLAGALLAVPLLIVMKAFAQHSGRFEALNAFMER